ncbi:Hypothetical Protein FCC1311_012202 [Hondaea fermentalgiana]|uniref:Uncharacterized protein n=1 Tax=Hondaea fermentalgiana TaxID=2315210 RepID=A0A2R5G943_9STRA|nr:Hypothetical Protein FCC1311_012202 [Hondaea fermentalgiana]|eukprot:GBG25003.1 Hypothetical Protein FCC1311_012202 [Hondaea fermentalgiana]
MGETEESAAALRAALDGMAAALAETHPVDAAWAGGGDGWVADPGLEAANDAGPVAAGREEEEDVALARDAVGGADPRGPICDQVLGTSRRLTMLPNMTTLASPVAMNANMCGLKATCCSVKGFNAVLGDTENFDLWIDSLGSMFSRFESDPQSFLAYGLGVLSQHVFTTNLDFGVLYRKVDDYVSHLVGDIGNQNLAIHVTRLIASLAGYYSALLCSACDPSQKLYVERNASANTLTLTLDEGLCLDMGRLLEGIMSRLQLVLLDYRNVDAARNLTQVLCMSAESPLNPGAFPRRARDGCLQMYKDLGYLHAYASDFPGPFVGALGCTSAASCGKLLCEETLQGMAHSYNSIRSGIRAQLEAHCVLPRCNPFSLGDYVSYFLPEDDALAPTFTQKGPRVVNRVEPSPLESRLDLYRFGCGGYLAQSACATFKDVTFASAHIEIIVITCSIAGVLLLLLAVFVWHRYFRRGSWAGGITSTHTKVD